MQFPGANGMNLNVDGQGGQGDLDLDDYVDLDHIFDEFLTRNFAEDPAAAAAAARAAVAQQQQAPQGLHPAQGLAPGGLPTLPLGAGNLGPAAAGPAASRPPYLSYPTDLASLHYSFGALPAAQPGGPHTHPLLNASAAAGLMPPVMTVGAPAVPPAASEANSLPAAAASKPAPKGRGSRRAAPSAKAAAAAAAAVAEDSDSSGVESASSDEPKSRKKTNTSSDPNDKSLAERRHQALQEKNRRAQRRFRERQKAKIQDLHKQIEELTGRVGSLQTENTALQSRTSILEKVLEMRNEQIQVMQETKEDPADAADQEVGPGATALAGAAGELEVLSPDLLRRLTPEEMTNIYQKYVGELGHRLMELNQTNNPEHKAAVEALVKDVLLLLMRFSIVKPLETRKFVAGSRLNIPSEQDALLLWKGAMKRLELSEEQQREMVALKREFLNSMENVMEQRRQLNVQIQAHFPHASFHTKIALAYIKAHEAVTKLKDNLRSEHRLVLEFSAALFKKILTPVQMATLLVHAFPAVPDSLAISSAVAAELGEDVMPLPAAPAADTTLSNTSLLLQALAPSSSEGAAGQQQRGINLPMGAGGSAGAGPSSQANLGALGALPASAQQLLAKVASGEVKLSPQMLQVLQMGGMGQLNPMQQQFLAFQQQQAAAAAAAAGGGGAGVQAGLLQQLQQQQQQMGLMGLLAGAGGSAASGAPDDSSSGSSGLAMPGTSRGL